MAPMVRVMIYGLGIVSWPVAKLLEFVLGSHHGIMYRRAELKELIAMHATTGELGGDLKTDTVTIIGATLDLQEKVVKQAMTPIDKVFMLNIDCKLDYDTLRQISDTGHSRVPVYEEVDVPLMTTGETQSEKFVAGETKKMKKIAGILLVKQCLMIDPRGPYKLHVASCGFSDVLYRRNAPSQSQAPSCALRTEQHVPVVHSRSFPGRTFPHGRRLAIQ